MTTRLHKVLAVAAVLVAVLLAPHNGGSSSANFRSDGFVAITFSPVRGDLAGNRSRLAELIVEASTHGARYIVLPELSLTGPLPNDLKQIKETQLTESIPGPSTTFFANYAKKLGVWLVISVAEKAQAASGYYVSTVLINDSGKILQKYRKVMPRADGEDGAAIIRGNPRAVLESVDDRGRRIGILSGDDIQTGVPRLAGRGAETVLVASNWSSQDAINWREVCLRLSREYKVNLVVANLRSSVAPARADTAMPSAIYTRDGEAIVSDSSTVNEQSLMASLAAPPGGSEIQAPLGLPSIPSPTYYTVSEKVIELGRTLFFDKSLSSNGKISCASCHQPAKAFADGAATGAGVGGRRTDRNVPSLLNVAYRELLFWDGFAETLENQAKYPMSHASEMNLHYLDATRYIRSQPEYVKRFQEAYGSSEIRFEQIASALASYQRTLISGNSAFDRYYYGGDQSALSQSARRGLNLFLGKANCVACHKIEGKYALLMDQEFHNTGASYIPAKRAFSDTGFGAISYEGELGLFLTPSLRNVAETSPYMHDGSLPTLEKVVEFYNRGGIKNPFLDRLIKPLRLTSGEVRDLVSFLHSLTGAERYTEDGRRVNHNEAAESLERKSSTVFAALQFTPAPGNVSRNRQELQELVTSAARIGSRFILLPEHAQIGPLAESKLSSLQLRRLAKGFREESYRAFSKLAGELRVWLVIPVLEYSPEKDSYFVTTLLLNDHGQIVGQHRKLSPKNEWGDGEALSGDFRLIDSIETPAGRIGILSGDDITRGIPRLADRGAATILISASWKPSDVVKWIDESIELAKRYEVNLVISNLRDGGSDSPSMFGAIILKSGEVVSKDTSTLGNEILTASIGRRIEPFEIEPPLGLPSIPQPTYRPLTRESVELGRKLFFDTNLSRDGKVSCASCHDPQKAFVDHKRLAEGAFGRVGKKNTPTLINSVYRTFQSWEGQVELLEGQVGHALHGYGEMDMNADEVVDYLYKSSEYREMFRAVTGRDSISFKVAAECLANYQRTLVAGDSPFDRYFYGGNRNAISERAKRGFNIFTGKAGCSSCHQVSRDYALFTDNGFHNTGVGYHRRFDYLGYSGNGIEGNRATRNKFRGEYLTPSLRNVSLTAPYMHDGSVPTLEDVVRFYNRGGIPNRFLNPRIKPLGLTDEEQKNLIEFMLTLTSDQLLTPEGLTTISSGRLNRL